MLTWQLYSVPNSNTCACTCSYSETLSVTGYQFDSPEYTAYSMIAYVQVPLLYHCEDTVSQCAIQPALTQY